jgi:hypothetical protein
MTDMSKLEMTIKQTVAEHPKIGFYELADAVATTTLELLDVVERTITKMLNERRLKRLPGNKLQVQDNIPA